MIVQTIEISLSKGRAPELLAHLGESNRQIEMVSDVTLPETAGAEIEIVKPDGTFAIQTAEITDGHIIVTLPDQACTVKGLSHYILKITDTGTVIYSAYGNIFVDDHLITDELIESVAEVNGYVFPDDFLTNDYIEANPSGTPADTLDTVKIDDIIYKVGVVQPIIYSTEEREIGIWIDGRPLYQKTYTVTVAAGTATTLETGIDFCFLVGNCYMKPTEILSDGYIGGGITAYCYVAATYSNNVWKMILQNMHNVQLTYCVTVRYTKITDTV